MILVTTAAHAFGTVLALFGLTDVHQVSHSHLGRGRVISALVLAMFFVSLLDAVLYFSMVTFTTLGYGDVTLDPSWRLLASFEAANGIVIFGWTTALIVAYVQRIVPRRHASGDAPS